jgi:8-oxo-dGTP pyrophosphatase MutT (NUDIX family)
MLTNMTEEERQKLASMDFDTLWTELWCVPTGKNFARELMDSKSKLEKLKNGYFLKTADKSGKIIEVTLQSILDNTTSTLTETEWGFPKGRRNFSDEDDRRCAMREFREETGIHLKHVRFLKNFKPFEEMFIGTNNVRYKHVYYVTKYNSWSGLNGTEIKGTEEPLFNPNNKNQTKEIRDVCWFNYNDAQSKIRDKNVERKELLKRINSVIVKYINMNFT